VGWSIIRVQTGTRNARFTKSPRKDHRGVGLISEALPFGRRWYAGANAAANAVGYAKFYSRSHAAVIRFYDEAGNVIEMHKQAGDFCESTAMRRQPSSISLAHDQMNTIS